jgi:hypothetical protein
MAKISKEEIIGKSLERSLKEFEKLEGSYSSISDRQKQLAARQEEYADRQRLINDLMANYNMLSEKGQETLDKLVKTQDDEYQNLKRLSKEQEKFNKSVAEGQKRYQSLSSAVQKLWGFLNENDKIIRQTILNLGMSGTKAELMRSSFEQSALYAAKLGGGLEDVQSVMMGFADETGRAVALSDEMVKSVLAMGKGTGLGVEQATKLAGQFEYMGIDAKSAMDYVQGVVDTSERMGVNTTKVLKTVTENFKKLSTFTFQSGVKAFGQMAENAEKTRVSLATALNVAEATRGLEQVIELGANLQVMGGKFAEMDPFQWLYMARNEPDKMTAKISEMTAGIYSFKKNSEGVFEKVISPADRDRLANVAKSLGIAQEEMFEIAQRRLDLSTMDKQLAGSGLTGREKELVEGAAKFDSRTGKFQVMLAGHMQDISTLTKEQANSFVKEQSTLEERAKQAQTFDEAFKATINELKSVLLPMLQGVKKVLDFVRPIAEGLTKFVDWAGKSAIGEWLLKGGGLIMAGGFILIKAFSLVGTFVGSLRALPATLGTIVNKFKGILPSAASAGGTAGGGAGGGTFGGGAGAALKGVGVGAGIGLAGVGMGKGIEFAATGISKLADSMSKLTPEQAKSLKSIAMTLAISFPLAAAGMAIFGAVGTTAILPILAIGAAMVGIGFGIKLATDGIGRMALGLAELNKSGGGAGKQLAGVAGGVALITLAMLEGGGLALFGLNNSLARMERNASGIVRVGAALTEMKLALSGSVDDFVAVSNALASIGKINIKGGGAFADMARLLSKPLQVEFADKRLTIANDITLNIDGERFTQKMIKVPAFIERTERTRQGLEG